jgi:hypothetical protein
MTNRKKPVRHTVSGYKRNNKPVRSYARGNGTSSKTSPKVIKSFIKSEEDRWEQISDGPDYKWVSKENPHITVSANLEEMEPDTDDEDEDYGEDYYKNYLVFPSYDDRGIPDSPETFSEGSSGSLSEARKDAIDLAKKIMKLPIEKIEGFNWDRVF